MIVSQAKIHLDTLEQEQRSGMRNEEQGINNPNQVLSSLGLVPDIKDPKYEKVETLLSTYDLNDITPLQALQLLSKIKDDLKE
ncbi:MAG: hypothetical protein WCL18_06280 [bacterium]